MGFVFGPCCFQYTWGLFCSLQLLLLYKGSVFVVAPIVCEVCALSLGLPWCVGSVFDPCISHCILCMCLVLVAPNVCGVCIWYL